MGATQPQSLFGRAYALTIGAPTSTQAVKFGNTGGARAPIRIGFTVEKVSMDAANKGTIVLYNVNQATRTALVKGQRLILEAGYQGLTERLMFGEVFEAKTARQGPDIVTTLTVIDGLQSLLYTVLDKTYPKGSRLCDILADIGRAMDAGPGIVLGIPNVSFPRGYTAQGLCRNTLRRLLKPLGLEASIQNGKLNILPKTAHLGKAAVVLSPKTGLLGVPSKSFTTVDFEALLNPKLVPGQLVHLITDNPNTSGFFRIRSSKMEGDTHDQKWSATINANALEQTVQTLSAAQGFDYGQAVVPGLI